MERREKLIFREADIAFCAADRRGRLLADETRHLGVNLGNQNQRQGVIGASVGNDPAVVCCSRPSGARALPGGNGSAQRTGTIRRGASSRCWTARAGNQTLPGAPASTGGNGSTGGRRFGQRLAAIRAELRAGVVLSAAILASARGHKVRWPNLLLNASLRHMRLARIALLVAATGCAASTAARRDSSPTGPVPNLPEPLHLTIVYPDTADPIQAQDSSFLFGSVGRGRSDVVLSINGFPCARRAQRQLARLAPAADACAVQGRRGGAESHAASVRRRFGRELDAVRRYRSVRDAHELCAARRR